jgi:hypothetical protein
LKIGRPSRTQLAWRTPLAKPQTPLSMMMPSATRRIFALLGWNADAMRTFRPDEKNGEAASLL